MVFTPLTDHQEQYPTVIAEAACAFMKEGRAAGAAVLAPIAGEIWSQRLVHGMRRRSVAAQTSEPRPRFNRELAAAVYVRDHFHCRHCVYPVQLPYHVNYKAGTMHPVFWRSVAEADHLLPPGAGGDWYAVDNHVTSCAACNTRKSDYTLADLRATPFDVGDSSWDGPLTLFRPLWVAAGEPGSTTAAWLRAFELAAGPP
jgi:5-methylcytosine-specific restriction endonuclease McrA